MTNVHIDPDGRRETISTERSLAHQEAEHVAHFEWREIEVIEWLAPYRHARL